MVHAEIKTHSAHLKALTGPPSPDLVDTLGVGFDIAAQFGPLLGGQGLPIAGVNVGDLAHPVAQQEDSSASMELRWSAAGV